MKLYSITRRLILMVLVVELTSALCVTAVAFIYERHTFFHTFDIMLRGQADSILGAVQDAEDAGDSVMLNAAEVHAPGFDVYSVRDANGRILGASPHGEMLQKPGNIYSGDFFETSIAGQRYRVLFLNGNRWVDAAEPGGGVIRHVAIYYGSPVRRVWHAVMRTVTFYAVSSLLVLAITGLWMLWFLNRALAPLRGLASGAANVTTGSWNFVAPEEARRTKELLPLVNAIEHSLAGLKEAFQQQKRFVGDAAHELKTALAVAKSSLQLVNMRPRPAADYSAGVDRCLEDFDRLESIVQQMLTLARAESATNEVSANAVTDVHELAWNVVHDLQSFAAFREVAIQLEGEQSSLAIIESGQCRLVLDNILMNALQHSPPKSFVRVSVRTLDVGICIHVEDFGEGIECEDIPQVFERFWRGDPSRSRKTGGTGLGLAIVKAVLDRWHGEIRISSKTGHGTSVFIYLRALRCP